MHSTLNFLVSVGVNRREEVGLSWVNLHSFFFFGKRSTCTLPASLFHVFLAGGF
ncbi:hypothetical protein SLEP1_g60233 [Rubroshorea leprosula]|uniref:Uncharacterized protein n=1 Tax=Rubroshorea leprosula TaxID=152421 RepID=A0AAV5MYF7_9ROSI|nr:hypothetical protein SLEP1_g60233 [Rubroshorea leprosula]